MHSEPFVMRGYAACDMTDTLNEEENPVKKYIGIMVLIFAVGMLVWRSYSTDSRYSQMEYKPLFSGDMTKEERFAQLNFYQMQEVPMFKWMSHYDAARYAALVNETSALPSAMSGSLSPEDNREITRRVTQLISFYVYLGDEELALNYGNVRKQFIEDFLAEDKVKCDEYASSIGSSEYVDQLPGYQVSKNAFEDLLLSGIKNAGKEGEGTSPEEITKIFEEEVGPPEEVAKTCTDELSYWKEVLRLPPDEAATTIKITFIREMLESGPLFKRLIPGHSEEEQETEN